MLLLRIMYIMSNDIGMQNGYQIAANDMTYGHPSENLTFLHNFR